jgi:cbb3-type cytochrome oxidase maturation protein
MVALFFVLFLLAFIWALRHRQLQDIEDVKFRLFEEESEEIGDEF